MTPPEPRLKSRSEYVYVVKVSICGAIHPRLALYQPYARF